MALQLHSQTGDRLEGGYVRYLLISLALGISSAAAFTAQTPTGTTGTAPAAATTAALVDTQGRSVGQASLQQTPNGLLVKLELRNAPPGTHALHIHQVGRCEGPSFESAGGHVGPGDKGHGFLNSRGPHAGDLPNIEVPTTGQLSVEHLVKDVTLDPGPASLLDADGSALVIHMDKDDYATDPAGKSGNRIACGTIGR